MAFAVSCFDLSVNNKIGGSVPVFFRNGSFYESRDLIVLHWITNSQLSDRSFIEANRPLDSFGRSAFGKNSFCVQFFLYITEKATVSMNSCARLAVLVIGLGLVSLWIRPCVGRSLRHFAVCTLRAWSIVACVWSTGLVPCYRLSQTLRWTKWNSLAAHCSQSQATTNQSFSASYPCSLTASFPVSRTFSLHAQSTNYPFTLKILLCSDWM